ncbi:MAG: dihydroneopterin aldolase [Burkholderiales bacterium]
MNPSEPQLHLRPLDGAAEPDRDVRALFLRNLRTAARIGVYPHEQGREQRLRFDLCVTLRPPYDWNDRLDDVLDYDRLRQGILDILAAGHINLLETLGERILRFCFEYRQVGGVHLQIVKLEAHDDCEVGLEMRRLR